jgi:hypothetical protein
MAEDIHLNEPIGEKARAAMNRRRWKEDAVESLPQGFSFKRRGRDGSIYYRHGDRILELIYEVSGNSNYDILISSDGIERWILPLGQPVDQIEQNEIKTKLSSWLKDQGARASIE